MAVRNMSRKGRPWLRRRAGLVVLAGALALAGCATPPQTADCGTSDLDLRIAPGSDRGTRCKVEGRDVGVTGPGPLMLATGIAADAKLAEAEAPADGGPLRLATADPPAPAKADPETTGSVVVPDDAVPEARRIVAATPPSGGRVVPSLTLPQAVALSLSTHPRIGAQLAAIRGAGADVDRAGGALWPTLTVSGGVGQGTVGSWDGDPHLFDSGSASGALRSDVGVTFRQLIYDWGAARSEIQRTRSVALAEKLKLADEAERVALQTADAYLKIIEQRQVLVLIDQTLSDYQGLAALVQASHKDGNGTLADVQRITSRMVEIRAMRADIDTDRVNAENEFRRLTGVDAKTLKPPRDAGPSVPASFDIAMRDALQSNPGLLALGEATRAYGAQKEGLAAARLPRIDVQGDGLLKNYSGVSSHSELDARAMVMVSYKLLDGGVGRAQTDRADADLERSRYQLQDEREQVELSLRRAFQARAAADLKAASIVGGVDAATSVKKLYLEQFRTGRKTIFEVIDSYMSYFTMRRTQINGQYDKLRAAYDILRATGRLNDVLVRQF